MKYILFIPIVLIVASCANSKFKNTLYAEELLCEKPLPVKYKKYSENQEKWRQGRSSEEVLAVLDCNQPAFDFLMYKYKMTHTNISGGKIVVEFLVMQSGIISKVKILDSNIKDDTLLSSFVDLFKKIEFSSRNVVELIVRHSIEL